MLKIKKIGAALLSIIMSIHIVPASLLASMQIYAEDNSETTKYVLPIQKNGIETLEIEVYEQDEKYYTIPQNIALLTGATYTDGERCPVYGGQSFTFTRGMFEVSVDAENQKMYSCLTEYDYSIRKTLNSKLSLVNSYLNLHDPIYDFTEFDEKITDEMIEQVDLPDEIKDVFLNEPEFSLETYALDNTDISVVEIDSTYMIELIPWLMYMGAECNTSDECLEVNMPYRTLWESIMPDLHGNTHNKVQAEKSTAHNVWDVSCSVFVDVISDIPGFIKYAFTDTWNSVTGQQSGDKYVEEAIYDILKVDYSNSQQINDKVEAINEFVGLANSDVINASASIYEFAYDEYDSYLPYLTNYIPNDKYEELCDRAIKMENLKNNTEALKFVLGCAVTINEKLNYSDDTKQSLNNVLGKNIDSYVKDDSDGKWTDTARRIMKDIGSTENIVTGEILKNGIDFLFDKGKDEGLALFGKQNYATLSLDLAKSLLINAPMFRPVWEGYDAQLYMIEQNEIQMDMLQLIDSLVKKAIITERCSNSDSLTELADALKFYYRAVIAHANNSVKYLEEVDMFNENQDALIKEYRSLSEKATEYLYNVSNCTVSEIPDYDDIDDSVLTGEWMESLTTDDSIELYSDVLDFFYNNISTNWKDFNSDYFDPENRRFPDDYISYMWWHYESERSLDKTYYSFIDLDNDGFDELLVGTVNGEHGDSIFDIFTYIDGKPVHLVTSAERDWYFLGKENVIGESGSSGAALSSTTYYRLENGKLQPIEKYIYDGYDTPDSPYYYADEFEYIKSEYEDYWYYSDKNRKNITEEEFYARNKYDSDSYDSDSKTIPDKFLFSEYTPSSDESSIDITGTVVDLGNCGKNVTWVLHNDGTLMISGRGEMDNFSSSQLPWAKEKNKSFIKKVIIENGVTSIGDDAFSGCEALTNVIIPDSITSIGKNVFSNCTSLTSISIPNSVNKIGESTFSQCCSLISVTIPEGVTNIDESLFWGCTSIESIIIPNTVSNIGNRAFSNCESLKSIILPNNLTKIGDNVFFGCKKITQIKIPKNVKNIGQEVFANCLELESIIVDDENKCYCSCEGVLLLKNKIKLIAYPAAKKETIYSIPNEVIYIDDYAFSDCQMLTSIILPDGLTIIGNWAFCECKSLSSITIPDGLTTIGRWAFSECKSLSSITIPYSVTNIGNCAFFGCDNLNDVYYPGTEEWISINNK